MIASAPLPFDRLKHLACGCARVEEQDGALVFHRFPEALAMHYRTTEAARIRLECPACVRLRFISDTRLIRIALRFGGQARPVQQSALVVDGMNAGEFGPNAWVRQWSGTIYETRERQRHVFEIWLPHLVRADLARLELEVDCLLEPAPPLRFHWLAYGDSITQGMMARKPTDTYVARVAMELGAEARNQGIGGGTLAPFLAETAVPGRFDWITVAYGVNDFCQNRPMEDLAKCTRGLLEHLRCAHPRTPVLLITPTPLLGRPPTNKAGTLLQQYRQSLADAAREFEFCDVVDGPSLVADDPSLFIDGLHPNEAGMAAYAGALGKRIAAILALSGMKT